VEKLLKTEDYNQIISVAFYNNYKKLSNITNCINLKENLGTYCLFESHKITNPHTTSGQSGC